MRVLNINELANAVKSAVLPGEEIEVKVLREGREAEQGVGYLEDGTMVVVEEGAPWSADGQRVDHQCAAESGRQDDLQQVVE